MSNTFNAFRALEINDKGVVNMVFGRGASAGAALVQHKRVPLISFTGGDEIQSCFRNSAIVDTCN